LPDLPNGQLLAAAEQVGFQVLVTVDQNMPHQQKLLGREICLVVLQARTTDFDDLLSLVPIYSARLKS
jgi:hypothetical protein